MVNRDIYKDEVDFAVLALQSPAFNKQYVSNPALRQTRLNSWKLEVQRAAGLQQSRGREVRLASAIDWGTV